MVRCETMFSCNVTSFPVCDILLLLLLHLFYDYKERVREVCNTRTFFTLFIVQCRSILFLRRDGRDWWANQTQKTMMLHVCVTMWSPLVPILASDRRSTISLLEDRIACEIVWWAWDITNHLHLTTTIELALFTMCRCFSLRSLFNSQFSISHHNSTSS